MYDFCSNLCCYKTTACYRTFCPTCALPSPSIICLPVVMFNAAALYHHLSFILFAEASVNQMPSIGVCSVREVHLKLVRV